MPRETAELARRKLPQMAQMAQIIYALASHLCSSASSADTFFLGLRICGCVPSRQYFPRRHVVGLKILVFLRRRQVSAEGDKLLCALMGQLPHWLFGRRPTRIKRARPSVIEAANRCRLASYRLVAACTVSIFGQGCVRSVRCGTSENDSGRHPDAQPQHDGHQRRGDEHGAEGEATGEPRELRQAIAERVTTSGM